MPESEQGPTLPRQPSEITDATPSPPTLVRPEFGTRQFWLRETPRLVAFARAQNEDDPTDCILAAVESILDGDLLPDEGVASVDFVLRVVANLIVTPEERGLLHRSRRATSFFARHRTPKRSAAA